MAEWISVKERLPSDTDTDDRTGYGCVLAYGPKSGVDTVSIDWLLEFENDITHWMPLPEPPKEDDHD